MKSFFRRKQALGPTTASPSFDFTGPFSADHDFMAAWLDVPVATILTDTSPEFSKLRLWLTKHPKTHKHFLLRHPIAGPSPRHSEFCLFALKAQILQGFQFLSTCETLINDTHFVQTPPLPEHPFPAGRHLAVISHTWRDLLQWHACLADLESTSKIERVRVEAQITSAQTAAAALIALLVSADAIPAPHVPVVNFASFDINSAELLNAAGRLKSAARRGSRCLIAIANLSSSIANTARAYAKGGQFESPELQIQRLYDFIADASEWLDRKRNCIAAGFDGAPFADHFMHPESMANLVVVHFLAQENHNADGFREFTQLIVQQNNLADHATAIVGNAVLTQLFAAPFAPTIVFDGPGTVDDAVIALALELVAIDDPIALLAAIGDAAPADDPAVAVRIAGEALAALTSAGSLVLRFAHDFTSPQYLTERGRAVRVAIEKFLGIEHTVEH
jgi:hypothetical protein